VLEKNIGQTWNNWLAKNAGSANANWDNQFWGALFTFKYLDDDLGKNLNNLSVTKGYNFFIINGDNNGRCDGKCKSSAEGKALACMCKSGTTNDCYMGAVLFENGKVTRLKGNNCK